MKDVQKSLLIRGWRRKRKRRRRSPTVKRKLSWKTGTRERGILSSCSCPTPLFCYTTFFDSVQTAENMKKMMTPQRMRPRKIEERKKVQLIAYAFYIGHVLCWVGGQGLMLSYWLAWLLYSSGSQISNRVFITSPWPIVTILFPEIRTALFKIFGT